MHLWRTLPVLAVSLLIAVASVAGEDTVAGAKELIVTKLNGSIGVEDIVETPIDGIFEVVVGAQVAYISTDGRYLVKGDIIDLTTGDNVTERRRESARVKALAEFSKGDMIVFSPPNPKHTITVFTDVDCAYCRKLHAEIDELNALGVRVQYLMYPRYGEFSPTGQITESWAKAENVWCSKNRNKALTRAKLGKNVRAQKCETPIKRHYELGQMVGFNGTPAIITEDGVLIAGYLPAEMLAARLDSMEAKE